MIDLLISPGSVMIWVILMSLVNLALLFWRFREGGWPSQ